MASRPRWILASVWPLGLVVALGAGVAIAAIPDSNGVISGCYTKVGGNLRVIDTEKGQTCLKQELPISWNQAGPQGPPGPSGDGAHVIARLHSGSVVVPGYPDFSPWTLVGSWTQDSGNLNFVHAQVTWTAPPSCTDPFTNAPRENAVLTLLMRVDQGQLPPGQVSGDLLPQAFFELRTRLSESRTAVFSTGFDATPMFETTAPIEHSVEMRTRMECVGDSVGTIDDLQVDVVAVA
jgi:hypothetical protein